MKGLSNILNHSYVPYSKRAEGAIVLSSEGHYFPGVRIENISYPLSISAAQNALFCCLSEGYTPQKLWVPNTDDPLFPFWEQEYNIHIEPLDWNNPPTDQYTSIILDGKPSPIDILSNLLPQARVANSNFPVAALIKTEMGYFSGVNIECTTWNLGLCAERIAIFKALTYQAKQLQELHIHSRDGEFSSPCGACRQVIIEHLPNRQVHLHHSDHSQSTHFSNDLMPYSFQASSLSNS